MQNSRLLLLGRRMDLSAGVMLVFLVCQVKNVLLAKYATRMRRRQAAAHLEVLQTLSAARVLQVLGATVRNVICVMLAIMV